MAQAYKHITRKGWADFDGVDAPEWLVENAASGFCALLNEYIPEEYRRKGCRYKMRTNLDGGLSFYLIAPNEEEN
jgi:hypothetical protein